MVTSVRRVSPRELALRALYILILGTLASGLIITADAGAREIGKYCGVVVFDRWDTCFLLSGPYITYVAERVKNKLRPYKGQAMQVDASDVFQPQNPGDALIRSYKIVGPAPDAGHWAKLDGLELLAADDFGPYGSPTFLIEVRNSGNGSTMIHSSQIGPTLLGSNPKFPFAPSDGSSGAVMTRGGLTNPPSWASTVAGVTYFASYEIDSEQPPEHFQLAPGQSMKARITFKVSPGQYQFLFGYGGGVHEEKSLASNAISFDLSERGVASLTK